MPAAHVSFHCFFTFFASRRSQEEESFPDNHSFVFSFGYGNEGKLGKVLIIGTMLSIVVKNGDLVLGGK